LDLAERAGSAPDDVAIDVGLGVLRVAEVENGLPGADPDRDRRNGLAQRPARHLLLAAEPRESHLEGDAGSRDGGAARAAIGLEDVAVESDGPLAEAAELGD